MSIRLEAEPQHLVSLSLQSETTKLTDMQSFNGSVDNLKPPPLGILISVDTELASSNNVVMLLAHKPYNIII